MKVENMTGNKGNKIANQFIVSGVDNNGNDFEIFQSYDSVIARTTYNGGGRVAPIVELDETYWDYSVTTSKYRNQFLGETRKETQAKIDSGEYILTDLNG